MIRLLLASLGSHEFRRWLLLLFFTFSSFVLSAQELFFTPSKVFQNISSLETYHIFQDSKGKIWVCTDAGVSCYDGNKVTSYTTEDGLVENVVFKGSEDRKGRIWFCTLSGFFCYFENGKFHSITANKVLNRYFKTACNNFFFIGENDTLFCGPMATCGLIKIPPQHNYGKIILINSTHTPFYRFIITNKLNPRESVMGFGGYHTVGFPSLTNYKIQRIRDSFELLWDEKKFTIPYRFKKIYGKVGAGNSIMGSPSNSGNTIYIPTGIELVEIKKNDTSVLHLQFPEEIIHIDQDKDEDLWISTKKTGGYFYKNSNLKSKPIRFLNGLSVSSVMVDREGTIWATTLEKGIFVSYNKALITLKRQDNLIGNIQVDSNRLSVICSSNKIAYFFKKDSVLIDTIQNQLPIELTAFYNLNNHFYIGTKAGLYYASSKKEIKSPYLFNKVNGFDIIPYNGDTVLILSWSKAQAAYQGKIYSIYNTNSTSNFITKLKDGTILVTTRNNDGVFQLKNNKFIPFLPELLQLRTRINSIVEDHNKRLWFATEIGVYCYDGKHMYQYTKQNGLVNSQINALTVDETNNIWGASSAGLFKINNATDLNKPTITNFNGQHGLPDLRIEKIATFDNKLWCLTRDYVFYFPTHALQKNSSAPLTHIPTIFINGNQLPFTDTLVTNHNGNNILIQPTSSSYKSPEKKGFIYKLHPYDKEWHYSAISDIKYTNLDHGIYELLVYALNNDNLKSNKPATLTLIIKPPFWLTWWFITLLIILFLFIIYLSARLWRKKIEKKERDKAAINQQLAEFKMTALRSQMNPHFIYNAIGSIQHYILKNEIDQSFNYLSKFSSLIRKVLNNSRNEFISLEEEVSTLQLYIELEQIRFKHPFQFVLQIGEELDMDIDIPTMLIQPYIENSIWHGLMPKESQGRLELLFKKVDSSIHVMIRDNGVGREKGDLTQKYHISKGMSLTEQRIQTLENTSKKKFITTITDLKDSEGNPIGTEVNLIIPFDE